MIDPRSPDRPKRYRWEDTGWEGKASRGAQLLRSAPEYYREGWRRLEEKLLQRGGEAVVHTGQPETDLFKIIERGQDMTPEGLRLRRGFKSDCHANVAALWRQGEGRIVIGYALSESMWRQHSWLVGSDGAVIETTIPRDAYHGFALDEAESEQFDHENQRGRLVKILMGDEEGGLETPWAEDLGDGQYRLDNLPWF